MAKRALNDLLSRVQIGKAPTPMAAPVTATTPGGILGKALAKTKVSDVTKGGGPGKV